MKSKTKRFKIAALILATTMMIGGCGPKAKDTTTKGVDENQKSTEEIAPIKVDADNPSWKNDTSPVELDWFVCYDWATHTFDSDNNTFDKYTLEETGIKINWSSGNIEKLNVLISTGSLPDIITYNVSSTERKTMEDNGLLYPLNELRDKYAPDFEVVPAMEDWYRNDDGNWYAYASYFYDIDDTYSRGGYLTSHNMIYARKDIMDQLDIKEEDMHTKDGIIEVLHKVQDAKVEYNGSVVDPWVNLDTSFLAEQFGLDREDKEGNWLNPMRQPEYLEALLFYNRLYREGLITDEEFTMDKQLKDQKVGAGGAFAGITHSSLLTKEDLFHTDNNALMGGVGFIKGDAGKEPIITPSPTGGWTGTMISKNCENPDRAIQLFAFLAREEGALAGAYGGHEGYDIVDGQAIIKSERKQERDVDPQAFNTKHKTGSMDYFSDFVYIQSHEPKEAVDAFVADAKYYRDAYMDGHYYDDKIFIDVNPDGGSELAAVQAQVDEYWRQQSPLVIMASTQEEATKIYNDAITQMDALGMGKLDENKNEKFQKNKEKMGLDLAWPRNQK